MNHRLEEAFEISLHAWRSANRIVRRYWKGVAIGHSRHGRAGELGIAYFIRPPLNLGLEMGFHIAVTLPDLRHFGVWSEVVTVHGFRPLTLNAGSEVRAQGMDGKKYEVFDPGTLGAVLRKNADQSLWALSANHVIGKNDEYADTRVVTPDGTVISEKVHSIKLSAKGNTADAAVAKLTIEVPNPNSARYDMTRKDEVVDPQTLDRNLHSNVTWLGSADNGKMQTSAICWPQSSINIEMDFDDIARADFDNQIIVDNVSGAARPGDSGSLVVLDDGRPLGILIAADEHSKIAVISPLKAALDAFEKMQDVGKLVLA